MTSHTLAVLQALFVTFLWSTSWVFIKIGLEDIPALTFAGLRYALAFLILLPVLFARREHHALRRLGRRDWLQLILLGLLLYSVTQGTQFLALDLLPAATLSLLLNFTTVAVAVMGIVLLAERPTWQQWMGTVIFLLGTVVYFYRDVAGGVAGESAPLIGLLIAGIGVLANAASAVLGRAVNRHERLTPLLITVVSMGIGAAVLLVSGIIVQGLPSLSPRSWLIIGWLALVNTAFAFTLWNKTLRKLSAVESSIINNTMLIQIAVLAWVFLDERLQPMEIAGLLLAAFGILLVQLRRTRQEAAAPSTVAPEEPPGLTGEFQDPV